MVRRRIVRQRLRVVREHESVDTVLISNDRAAPELETAIAPGGHETAQRKGKHMAARKKAAKKKTAKKAKRRAKKK